MTTNSHEPSGPLEIWMDGGCSLCRRSQAWCAIRDTNQRLAFRDVRKTTDAELPSSRSAHQSAMWVRTGNGGLYQGFTAWRLIMEELPGWRWLGRMAGLPPWRWIGPWVYRLVARFRHLVS